MCVKDLKSSFTALIGQQMMFYFDKSQYSWVAVDIVKNIKKSCCPWQYINWVVNRKDNFFFKCIYCC